MSPVVQMRKQARKGEHTCSGQFAGEGQSWPERRWPEPALPAPCASEGPGWACRAAGGTVPGCVLCTLHAGLGYKHLFLQALSHALAGHILTAVRHRRHGCTYTHSPPPEARLPKPQTSHYGHLCLEMPPTARPPGVGAALGSTHMRVTISRHFRVVACGGRADHRVWSQVGWSQSQWWAPEWRFLRAGKSGHTG